MIDASGAVGHLAALALLAVALGMDAFSLGVGIGLRGVRAPEMWRLGLCVTFFHFLMPLCGMVAGRNFRLILDDLAHAAAGVLLLFLGAHMIYNSLRGGNAWSIDHRTFWGMILYALGVSIDSFSVGLSLGMFWPENIPLAAFMFGLAGGGMNMAGLLAGRRLSLLVGDYGEALGGAILLGFGLLFLL
ncbi:MAG TPA: manganese efflux pump [Paenibacillaceae bacterium]